MIQKKKTSEDKLDNILTVKVSYKIGSKAKTIKGEEMIVIGYDVVQSRGVRYVVMDGSETRKYMYDFEIKGQKEKQTIGFIG